MSEARENRGFIGWMREQSEALELAEMEGFSNEEALKLLKLYQMERIADALEVLSDCAGDSIYGTRFYIAGAVACD